MAQVEIVNLAAFYGKGAKTEKSDKVYGTAKVGNTLVSFWGRRNSRLSFKTRAGVQGRRDAESKWYEKIGGRKSGDVYTSITNRATQALICPNLEADVVEFFYSKMAKGQLKKG